MDMKPSAGFTSSPVPTTFIVNVIHAFPGKQDEAFQIIQDVVHYVAEKKPGLWSNLAKSTDGLTVVNIEAIRAQVTRTNSSLILCSSKSFGS
jgi:hypothetical protein